MRATLLAVVATMLLTSACATQQAPSATSIPDPEDAKFAFLDKAPTDERAITILRRNLRRRGLSAEVVAGPMAVVTTPDNPDAPLAAAGDEYLHLMRTWPAGAALVVTAGGRWWVWDYGSTAPADVAAQQIVDRIGTRGL